MDKIKKNIIYAIIVGIAITLISGLIPRRSLLGATSYGWPLIWLIHLVIPQDRNPWRFKVMHFIYDLLFWSLVSLIPLQLVMKKFSNSH